MFGFAQALFLFSVSLSLPLSLSLCLGCYCCCSLLLFVKFWWLIRSYAIERRILLGARISAVYIVHTNATNWSVWLNSLAANVYECSFFLSFSVRSKWFFCSVPFPYTLLFMSRGARLSASLPLSVPHMIRMNINEFEIRSNEIGCARGAWKSAMHITCIHTHWFGNGNGEWSNKKTLTVDEEQKMRPREKWATAQNEWQAWWMTRLRKNRSLKNRMSVRVWVSECDGQPK